MLPCIWVLIPVYTFAQKNYCYNTKLGNDSVEISYVFNGKKGVIKEPHKIPVYSYKITDVPKARQAKSPVDTLKMSSLNYKLLDSLIWDECNKYRQEKKLKPVKWNDTIYAASDQHSQYQAYYNIVGHGEKHPTPGREKEQTLYNKVRVFTGEICLINSLTNGKKTYAETAKMIIEQWKKSPGHNAIMINPKYSLNAFSCAFRYNSLETLFTRENLLKYNPQLLKKIEAIEPWYFRKPAYSSGVSLYVWSTGNFMDAENVKEQLEFIENATKIIGKDGTVTYRGNGNAK